MPGKGKQLKCPKRPATAFMLWLNAHRSNIKESHPDASVTFVARVGGQIWQSMGDDERSEWMQRAHLLRKEYTRKMKKYLLRGGVKPRNRCRRKQVDRGKAKRQKPKQIKKKNAYRRKAAPKNRHGSKYYDDDDSSLSSSDASQREQESDSD